MADLDVDRVSKLISTFHSSLNVPNTANIQRELQAEIKQINEDLAIDVQPQAEIGQDEQGRPIRRGYPGQPTDDPMRPRSLPGQQFGPETGTDDSGASQGQDENILPQEVRRI